MAVFPMKSAEKALFIGIFARAAILPI